MTSISSAKKVKPVKNYIAYVHIKFKDRTNWKMMKIENEKELKSVEKYLMKHIRAWSYAALKQINTNAIIHYYHPNACYPKTGLVSLDLEAYKEQFTAYSLYIIPTSSYKRKTGLTKGKSQRIYDLESIHKYWTKDVLRIDVYVEGKKVNSYENGRFLK